MNLLLESSSDCDGSAPHTSTILSVPNSKASSIALLFSSIAALRFPGSLEGKNPPRQRDTIDKPWLPQHIAGMSDVAIKKRSRPQQPEFR